MREESYDHMVKILLIGDSGVGKTCLLQRLNNGEFTSSHLTTIAIDFKMKIFEVRGVKLKMQIWDTAGQERFNTLTSGFFKGSLNSRSWNHRGLQYRGSVQLRLCEQMDEPDPHTCP